MLKSSLTVIKQSIRCALNKQPTMSYTSGDGSKPGIALPEVIQRLENLASLKAAEEWDNVGLLVDQYKPKPIKRLMLTNDLTEPVLREAIAKAMDMIVSYHPPIFAPLKRITNSNWKERIVLTCIAESIAVYSPHTAWDGTPGRVNEWLAEAFGAGIPTTPIKVNATLGPDFGAGRIIAVSLTVQQAVAAVQRHIGADAVHLALANGHTRDTCVRKVGLCAGSGYSVVKSVFGEVDLVLTGEMSHHELLDATHRGTTVILCNHSNSERGYLARMAALLKDDGLWDVVVSAADKDPLVTQVSGERAE